MKKILHLCQILRQPDSIHAPGLCRDILFNHYKGVPRNFHWREPSRGEVLEGSFPLSSGEALEGSEEGLCLSPEFFLFFKWKWCILVHLYAQSLLKSKTSQLQPITMAST